MILDEIGEYIKNPVFNKLCAEIETKYNSKAKIEYLLQSSAHISNFYKTKYITIHIFTIL